MRSSHIRDLAAAIDLPLNADFEAGFARDAEGVHESARLCVGAGVAGFSIEDYTGDPAAPLFGVSEACERLRAARAAINESGETVLFDRAVRIDPAPGRRACRSVAPPRGLRRSRRRRSLRSGVEDG